MADSRAEASKVKKKEKACARGKEELRKIQGHQNDTKSQLNGLPLANSGTSNIKINNDSNNHQIK
jgi:hypothetical protein